MLKKRGLPVSESASYRLSLLRCVDFATAASLFAKSARHHIFTDLALCLVILASLA